MILPAKTQLETEHLYLSLNQSLNNKKTLFIMKKLTYKQHYELIIRAKKLNQQIYTKAFKDAKKQLLPQKFAQLQNQILDLAS